MLTDDEIKNVLIPHLSQQFRYARPILFTGAGFSLGAKTASGQSIPTYGEVQQVLWNLCFPGSPFEADSTLQDLYEQAVQRHRRSLPEVLKPMLTVDPSSLPEWYRDLLSLPWARCYTLNIDNLEAAADLVFDLPRRIRSISAATSLSPGDPDQETDRLEVVHLNGMLQDMPDGVTFSLTQYAERLARSEPWYLRLHVDLLTHPFVFVGTRLDEPPLWQHIVMRGPRGGRGTRELRHRSYLVTPSLPKARQALMTEFNVQWLSMTAEQFSTQIVPALAPAGLLGQAALRDRRSGADRPTRLVDVATLAAIPQTPTEFLLGHEPVWADIQSGKAAARHCDDELFGTTKVTLARASLRGAVLVTGTAGAGKSASLMRLCLSLVADGVRVAWIGRGGMAPRDIRKAMRADDAPRVLAIDDADTYGSELSGLMAEIATSDGNPLLLLAMRSGRIEHVLNPAQLKDIPIEEVAMPPLCDTDIDGLLDVLTRENRLGILAGKSRSAQVEAFRVRAGRQLLVAMIEATSGRPFKEKVYDELTQLETADQFAYALLAVASSFRIDLTRDEVLLASGDRSNAVLNALDTLARRHVIAVDNPSGALRARHRVIADILVEELARAGQLGEPLFGLALVAASKVSPGMSRSARPARLLRQLMNHDFLKRTLGVEQARAFYGQIEAFLFGHFHFWLQRGSLEVESGDLDLAQHFLDQARGLAPDDPFVETEYAYLMFRRALAVPGASGAPKLVDEAIGVLEDLIRQRGKLDPRQYHVMGSQGLQWSVRGIGSREARASFLRKLIAAVEDGTRNHPRSTDLEGLLRDLRKTLLSIAASDS